jgi:hypothetical protein
VYSGLRSLCIRKCPPAPLEAILSDISALRERLLQPDLNQVDLPYGSALRIEKEFGLDVANKGRCLAALLSALEESYASGNAWVP